MAAAGAYDRNIEIGIHRKSSRVTYVAYSTTRRSKVYIGMASYMSEKSMVVSITVASELDTYSVVTSTYFTV